MLTILGNKIYFFPPFLEGATVPPCSSNWQGTCYIDQTGLILIESPVSPSRVLGLKMCATKPSNVYLPFVYLLFVSLLASWQMYRSNYPIRIDPSLFISLQLMFKHLSTGHTAFHTYFCHGMKRNGSCLQRMWFHAHVRSSVLYSIPSSYQKLKINSFIKLGNTHL